MNRELLRAIAQMEMEDPSWCNFWVKVHATLNAIDRVQWMIEDLEYGNIESFMSALASAERWAGLASR